MWSKILEFIKNLFKTPVQALPKPVETPVDKPIELPKNEPTTTENPNWSVIASLIRLDPDIKKQTELETVCNKIIQNRQLYYAVEAVTKVPAKLIAAIHYMESSLNFKTILHNGTPLGQVSKIVPVGVKFDNWHDAAVDALKRQGCDKITDWSFANMLAFAERYNGLGYRKHGVYSNYVVSYTNFSEEIGRYVSDGKWDENSPHNRPGVASIILMLNKIEGEHIEEPVKVPVETPKEEPTQGAVKIDRAYICSLMAEEFKLIAGAKEKGNNTDNGGIVDKVILTAGGRLGWPYCALTVTYIVMQVCKKLSIAYPKDLYRGASSQGFKNSSKSIYVSKTLKLWSAFVHTNSGDTAHGHIGLVYSNLYNGNHFQTAEGNFSQQINYFDKTLDYVAAFVDIPQAILDQWQKENAV